jgi:arginine deiminase
MRILRSYTIETEYVERLKNDGINASELFNTLLKNYFKDKDFEDFNETEIKLQLQKLDIEERHINEIKEWEKQWEQRKK